MAAGGGCIDFMFLGPPYPAAGSATAKLLDEPTIVPVILLHFPIEETQAKSRRLTDFEIIEMKIHIRMSY